MQREVFNALSQHVSEVRHLSLPPPLFTFTDMYTGIAQAQHTLHVVSTEMKSTRMPQTHKLCPPLFVSFVITVIFGVRGTVNNSVSCS